MKQRGNVRFRIALLVGGSVLLTLFIIVGAFNLLMQRRMKQNAENSLRRALLSDTENSTPALYTPETVAVFDRGEDTAQLYNPKELSVINWCADKPSGEMLRAEIDGNDYYIMSADKSELTDYSGNYKGSILTVQANGDMLCYSITQYHDGDEPLDNDAEALFAQDAAISYIADFQRVVGYVDITGELAMIQQINLVFLIAALVIGLFGSTAGFFIGKKLEQNQLAQKQFFENTSHELKTPLTSIRGYAEGIEKGIITDYPRTGRTIAAQTEKMSRLVEEILCMAKLESGAVKPERETIELTEFLQDCLMPFEGTVMNRGLQVTLDLHPMTVSADSNKLEHAVSNLLTNALKYAQTKISVFCGDGEIRIANDCAPLTDDTLAHLFERFYSGRDGNTGIGLSLAKDLIALHGWRISAVRTEDGICFVVDTKRSRK